MYYGIKARNLLIVLQLFHPKPWLVKFKQVHAVCSYAAQCDIAPKIFNVPTWVFIDRLHAPVCLRSTELVEIRNSAEWNLYRRGMPQKHLGSIISVLLCCSTHAICYPTHKLLPSQFPLHRPYKSIVEGFDFVCFLPRLLSFTAPGNIFPIEA